MLTVNWSADIVAQVVGVPAPPSWTDEAGLREVVSQPFDLRQTSNKKQSDPY